MTIQTCHWCNPQIPGFEYVGWDRFESNILLGISVIPSVTEFSNSSSGILEFTKGTYGNTRIIIHL